MKTEYHPFKVITFEIKTRDKELYVSTTCLYGDHDVIVC